MLEKETIIFGKDIKKSYESLCVLDVEAISIQKNKVTALTGPSGAGKSTLLHILGTLLKPTSGHIYIDQTEISLFSEKKLANFRNQKLGFIFQFHNLLPEFSAFENIVLPAMIAGTEKSVYTKKANELLTLMNLSNRAHHKPSEMSGGEQQRIAIARALINDPQLIFADEPTGNLDTKNAFDLHQLFINLSKVLGHTFLIVTHNNELASMSDKVIQMKDGKIVHA
jgi:lipoprotein-releasing system ATP-binding protein